MFKWGIAGLIFWWLFVRKAPPTAAELQAAGYLRDRYKTPSPANPYNAADGVKGADIYQRLED